MSFTLLRDRECPKCGFGQLLWLGKEGDLAWYECEACGEVTHAHEEEE